MDIGNRRAGRSLGSPNYAWADVAATAYGVSVEIMSMTWLRATQPFAEQFLDRGSPVSMRKLATFAPIRHIDAYEAIGSCMGGNLYITLSHTFLIS